MSGHIKVARQKNCYTLKCFVVSVLWMVHLRLKDIKNLDKWVNISKFLEGFLDEDRFGFNGSTKQSQIK